MPWLAAALKENQTAAAWGEGAQAGLGAIQHYGGAKPGDRTMLDALAPAITAFQSKNSSGNKTLFLLHDVGQLGTILYLVYIKVCLLA